ncbi:MAG: putative DNA binding domain-containing protein, partial [Gammaproteobacteria bacterium]|nr:putative DNA binding domain-containing protein [Gammaproteobacteria bacterium]
MNEGQHIEWKPSWRDEYLKWICGFANAQGGVLEIGKDDNGKVLGLKSIERLLEEIPNKVVSTLGIVVDVNLEVSNTVPFLSITVKPYPRPISYKGQYHYRSGSTKQVLKGAALERFLLEKVGRTWDGSPIPGPGVEDLDERALATFRRAGVESQRLPPETLNVSDKFMLDKLNLIDGGYLKRAGVLLFHPEPHRLISGAYVKIGYFRDDATLSYQDEVRGPILAQVELIVDILLTKYLKAAISYQGIRRKETFPVAEYALREALLNAVAHKDYSSSIPVQIKVYDDKLVIWNPGQLPPGWTIDNLVRPHTSIPFNPDIAEAFFRAGMIEAWGRGIGEILKSCRLNGFPEPVLRVDGGMWVEFPFRPDLALHSDNVRDQVSELPELQPES